MFEESLDERVKKMKDKEEYRYFQKTETRKKPCTLKDLGSARGNGAVTQKKDGCINRKLNTHRCVEHVRHVP